MTVNFILKGAVPEKDYTLRRINGEIKQKQEVKDWEYETKKQLKGKVNGWLSQTDEAWGEYTPLRVKVDIYTPHKTILIKQLKALCDALTGVVYMDDSTIVDLIAEKKESETEFVRVSAMPADKSLIQIPNEKCVVLNEYMKPRKNTVWDNGHPLDAEANRTDMAYIRYIRQEFAQQQEDLIDGEFDLFAIIGAAELKKRTPLVDRNAAYDMDTFPIITPDADNVIYALLTALKKWEYDKPEDLRKLHVVKTYYNPENGRNRIWLRNFHTTEDQITLEN